MYTQRGSCRFHGISFPLTMIFMTCFALVFSICLKRRFLLIGHGILRRAALPLVPRCRNLTNGTSSARELCEVVHEVIYRLFQEHNIEHNLGILNFADSFACYVVTLTFQKSLDAKISQFFLYKVDRTIRSARKMYDFWYSCLRSEVTSVVHLNRPVLLTNKP